MSPVKDPNVWTVNYRLKYPDRNEKDFLVKMDSRTLDIVHEPKESYPDWTKLQCCKCVNCPLEDKEHEYCPIAMKITDVVDLFCKPQPSKSVDVRIETPERIYTKNVELKTAAFSLLGIYMSTSGCPIMDKLRPMSRFHLPFATAIETGYRSYANYLIAQYLLSHEGREADFKLEKLGEIYEAIETVNMHFRERLQEVSNQNYALTALLQLDSFASYIHMSLGSDAFFAVENLFEQEARSDESDIETEEPQEKLTYEYQFNIKGDQSKSFTINLNRKNLRLINKPQKSPPEWAQLTSNKCPKCPLDEKKHKDCPAAIGISEAIEFFKQVPSTKEANIQVKTDDRCYSVDATATAGISAMMGLIMASSGCPVVGKLKPLVRNHLPFATNKETVYRSLGMYLLSQYFLARNGKEPDWKLANFTKLYEEINIVNKAFCNRLRASGTEDASLNALIKLDCFAQQINLTISAGQIEELLNLFKAYFK